MRSAWFVWVMVCMVLSSNSLADFDFFPVCTETGIQQHPALNDQIMVWSDGRLGTSDYNIYGKRFSEPNLIEICTASGNQIQPAVSGSVVVWEDARYGNPDIYGYDLDLRQEFPVCTNGSSQQNPAVSGSIIVWQDARNGNTDIYGYDLTRPAGLREFVICDEEHEQLYPAIDYPWVVWADDRNGNYDIYAKNLLTGVEQAVCTDTAEQFYPAVSGTRVVWQDKRNKATMDTDIYGRLLTGGSDFAICSIAQRQKNPVIYGSFVVWEDRRNGSDYDLYMYNFDTGITQAVTTWPEDQGQAAVGSEWIVWQSATNLYRSQIPVPASITVLSPNGSEMFLAGTSVDIEWISQGPVSEYVDIFLSDDNGQSWIPVAQPTANMGSVQWVLPSDLDSEQCLIQISDSADSEIMDQSESVFTVFMCETSLTADLTGDCFVDLEDFAVLTNQWLLCGNPYDSNWCFE